MKWVLFWDMHSGGRCKLAWEKIYIQAADRDDAIKIFKNKFDRDPYNITCRCCGCDYSVEAYSSLELASACYRNCAFVFQVVDGVKDYQTARYIEGDGRGKGEPIPPGWSAETNSKAFVPMEEYLNDPKVNIIGVYDQNVVFKEKFNFLGETDALQAVVPSVCE